MSTLGTPPRARRKRRVWLWAVVGIVGIVGLYFLVTFLQVWKTARTDHAAPAEAIVVLGAAQYNGRPSAVYRARLDHAADLYEQGIGPVVVVTGGKQTGDQFTEATAGADTLHERGVPDDAILREVQGRSTYESLEATQRFLAERGIDDVVLVTDGFHALRARLIASEVGLNARTSPATDSPIRGASEWWQIFGETLRVGVGRILGFGRMQRWLGLQSTPLAMLSGPSALRAVTHSGVV